MERDINPKDLRSWGDLWLLAAPPRGAHPHDPGSALDATGKGLWKAENPIPRMFPSLGTQDLLVGTWSTGGLWDSCPKFLSNAGITLGSVTHPLSPWLGAISLNSVSKPTAVIREKPFKRINGIFHEQNFPLFSF